MSSCNQSFFVWLVGCVITTKEPFNQLALNFDWVTWENHRNIFILVLNSNLGGKTPDEAWFPS